MVSLAVQSDTVSQRTLRQGGQINHRSLSWRDRSSEPFCINEVSGNFVPAMLRRAASLPEPRLTPSLWLASFGEVVRI